MEEKITATMRKNKEFEKPKIPEGFYPCKCVDVKRVSEGKYGERIAILCNILECGCDLVKVVYLKLTTDSGATKVIEAFGFKFVEGKMFDFNQLIGTGAIAVVEDYEFTGMDGTTKVASSISKFKLLQNNSNKLEVKEELVK